MDPALEADPAYDWPGNVRELRNVADDLYWVFGRALTTATARWPSLSDQLSEYERRIIKRTLAEHGNKMKLTYEALGYRAKGCMTRFNVWASMCRNLPLNWMKWVLLHFKQFYWAVALA